MTGRCDNDSIYRLSKVKNTSGVVFIARGVVVIIVIPILRICLEEEFISALATRHRRLEQLVLLSRATKFHRVLEIPMGFGYRGLVRVHRYTDRIG